MPRPIDQNESIASIRSEIRFTRARLKHEPRASEVTTRTDLWNDKNDALEADLRGARDAEADADAALVGANDAIDQATVAFADALHAEAERVGELERWHAFFKTTVSDHNRQDFREQVRMTREWLTRRHDPVLEEHRDALEQATARCELALRAERAAHARGVCAVAQRQLFVAWLNAQRDALHDELSRIARNLRLGRAWADSFYRGRSRRLTPPVQGRILGPCSPTA